MKAWPEETEREGRSEGCREWGMGRGLEDSRILDKSTPLSAKINPLTTQSSLKAHTGIYIYIYIYVCVCENFQLDNYIATYLYPNVLLPTYGVCVMLF